MSAPATPPLLELRSVSKSYATSSGRHTVLRDVTFSLPPRTSLGLFGRNGAGKSTLMRLIGGVEAPTLGEIRRHGRVSWPIGFAGGFNGNMSGLQNCRFVARLYGQDPDRVVEETREFAEIGAFIHEPVKTYSSGMRARVAFGLSMAIDFDLYLVDEITAVGDKLFRRKCRAAFAARRERAGVIMVSHDPTTLAEYCTTCALVDQGRVVMYDSVAAAKQAYDEKVPE